ncbi:MAG: NAD(P)-dependent oxidoreductase [Deltaproteobacteria bacterium]|jgi:phosphoglycerate dehydrogenase-like enzyme
MMHVLSILPKTRFTKADVDLPADLIMHFEDVRREEDIIQACRGMDFLLVPAAYPPITAAVLAQIPTVRMIQSAGAGYDPIDVESAASMGIPVANSPGHNTGTVAELALAMIIALQRRVFQADREIKAGRYQSIRESLFQTGLQELGSTTLGLIGLGAIGRKVAQIAELLGASIFYYDLIHLSEAEELALKVRYKPLQDLLAVCDVVSLHVPLTPSTRGLIGAEALTRMPRGAYLVNTARGELIEPGALAEALESGHIAGAALDTLAPEPPAADHPLLNLSQAARERLLLTPHIAGTTQGAFHRMLTAALKNMQAVASGGLPQHVVNGIAAARMPGQRENRQP